MQEAHQNATELFASAALTQQSVMLSKLATRLQQSLPVNVAARAASAHATSESTTLQMYQVLISITRDIAPVVMSRHARSEIVQCPCRTNVHVVSAATGRCFH